MTSELRNDLLAKAMVGRYRLGYIELSLLIAGTLFETIINQKLKVHDKWSDSEIESNSLEVKVNRICDMSKIVKKDSLYIRELRHVFTAYRPRNENDLCEQMSDNKDLRLEHVKKRLNNFRWLRNQIMHGKFFKIRYENDNIVDDFVNYIWSELAHGSFKCYLEKWERNIPKVRIVDTIIKHTADYMIRGIDEVDIQLIDNKAVPASENWSFDLSNLGNLFDVRDKLLELKNYLSQWLEKNANHLHTNTLTTIDTTSAYIWMPLTRIDSETQQGIISCTVSILATPLDFRIYMDFGGMAVNYRKQYYDFLGSETYRDLALTFISTPNFYVFDTEWYCFITKKRSMCSWLTDYRDGDLKAAQVEVGKFKDSISDQITWNRMLHGYIFDQEHLVAQGSIDLKKIESCLTSIINFNRVFEEFRSQRNQR